MKNIILSSLLLFSIFCVAQNSIYVQYKFQITDEEKLFINSPETRKFFLDAVENPNKSTFGLIIDDGKSKFFEENNSNSSSIFSGFTGEVFYKKDSTYTKNQFLGNNIFIKRIQTQNWILSSETQLIDNFLCYKATNVNVVIGLNNKIWNHPVVAWYCPKLPYNVGPNGYGNLPGLILQLQVRNVVFSMTKMDLKSKQNIDLSFLKKAKFLTEDEMNAIYEKQHQEDKKMLENFEK